MNTSLNPATATAGKYLTFMLGAEHFSLPVLRVREIIRLISITPVPRMPAYIKGVINLRGKIIPVIDLRERFSMNSLALVENDRRCIIVVQFKGSEGINQHMGMIVDAVEEVSQYLDVDIEATPDFGSALDPRYIIGMAKNRGTVRTLLDLDKMLNMESFVQMIGSESGHSNATVGD
jgi:purine-binding chemotaxis protein CheW